MLRQKKRSFIKRNKNIKKKNQTNKQCGQIIGTNSERNLIEKKMKNFNRVQLIEE